MTTWRISLLGQTWTAQKLDEHGDDDGMPFTMTAGQAFVVTDDEPEGALEWRGGMVAATHVGPPEGPVRWSMFEDDELRWLALGVGVAEGEGLLPPLGDGSDEYAEFVESLNAADDARQAEPPL